MPCTNIYQIHKQYPANSKKEPNARYVRLQNLDELRQVVGQAGRGLACPLEVRLVAVHLVGAVSHECQTEHFGSRVKRADARLRQDTHAHHRSAAVGEDLLVVAASLEERPAHHDMAAHGYLRWILVPDR